MFGVFRDEPAAQQAALVCARNQNMNAYAVPAAGAPVANLV